MRKNLGIVKSTWNLTFKDLKEHPRILVPFFIAALAKVFFLTVFYYSPRRPLLAIFGPPVKKFLNEAYLHYPANFTLLRVLFYYGEVLVWLGIGVCMWAAAVNMVNHIHEGRLSPSLIGSFNRAIRNYLALFLFALMIFILSLIAAKIPSFLIMKFYFLPKGKSFCLQTMFFVSFLFIIAIEAMLIYAIPALIIEGRSFISALKRTFSVSKQMFIPSFILVFLPRLFDLIMAFLKQKLPFIMSKTLPEMTLFILGLSIAVTLVADFMVVTSATNLFLIKRSTEEK